MPEGLVNVLTREEIMDLIAYIQAGSRIATDPLQSTPPRADSK